MNVKNRPIRESLPIALETSVMLAPVASQIAEIELTLEILCARNAFAAYSQIYISSSLQP